MLSLRYWCRSHGINWDVFLFLAGEKQVHYAKGAEGAEWQKQLQTQQRGGWPEEAEKPINTGESPLFYLSFTFTHTLYINLFSVSHIYLEILESRSKHFLDCN